MENSVKDMSHRILILIASTKLAGKAEKMFHDGGVPVCCRAQVMGTVPGEMTGLLGLGDVERVLLATPMPKPFADNMLQKLKEELRLGVINSGIAFTIPLSGANNLILKMMNHIGEANGLTSERKDGMRMTDVKHVLIAVVINQGYSEDVMKAARNAGAGGGSIIQCRRIGSEEQLSFWGFDVQEKKEIVLIVASVEQKLGIMQAIGDNCGVHTEAQGIVLSLPIDTVMGLREAKP